MTNVSKRRNKNWIAGLLASTFLCVPGLTYAQDNVPEEVQSFDVNNQNEILEDGEIVATGTNLRNSTPTANLTIFSREDIVKSGVTSIEQYLRRLPQTGVRTDPTVGGIVGGQGGGQTGRAFGIDLRGLGAQNTLVLVNGRRLATSSFSSQPTDQLSGFTDISSIPLSSVERIELVTEGASAIYGADAVGGVINIILLSDYTGGTTKLRFGDSSTGLDDFSAQQTLGFSVGKLSSLLNFSYRHESRGSLDRLPSFSQEQFEQFGVDSGINGLFNTGSPGVVTGLTGLCDVGNGIEDCNNTFFDGFLRTGFLGFPNANQITFPAGLGRAPTLADALIDTPGNGEVFDPILSPGLDEFTFSGNFDYDLSESTELRANGFVSYRETAGISAAPTVFTPIFFGDPNNPFDEDVQVAFNLFQEVADGVIERPSFETETLTFTAGLGLTHRFANEWQLRIDGNYSQDDTSSVSNQLDIDAVFNLQFEPLNPFGPGLLAEPEVLRSLFSELPLDSKNETVQLTAILDGDVYELPGGAIKAAVGVEYRDERFDFDAEALQDFNTGEINSEFCLENPFSFNCSIVVVDQTGSREIFSAFGEVNVPVINDDMQIPFVQSLTATAAARYDRYTDLDTRDRVSPSFGARWVVNDNLQFRGNYSESFRAPDVRTLTQLQFVSTQGFDFFEDPLSGGAFVTPDTVITGGNPDLGNEIGESTSFGAIFQTDIGPGNLILSGNYFITEISNQIGSISNAAQLFIFENSDQFPELIERDEFGNVTRYSNININVANVDVRGYDINATYNFPIKNYDVDLNVAYTRNTRNETEVLEGTGVLDDFIGTANGPERFSLVSKLEVSRGTGFTGGVIGRFHPSYTFEAFPANDPFADQQTFDVDGQLFIDIYAAVELSEFSNKLNGFRLAAGANNLFDPQPNFFGNSPIGLNFGRGAEVRGRVAYVEISKEF